VGCPCLPPSEPFWKIGSLFIVFANDGTVRIWASDVNAVVLVDPTAGTVDVTVGGVTTTISAPPSVALTGLVLWVVGQLTTPP
jgi:hypothetical protein